MQEMGAVRAIHIIDGDLLDRRERLRGRVRRLQMPVELSIPSGHAREISEHNPADPTADVRTSSYTFATLDLGSQ
ncbi:hypothetical protein SAMN04490240_0268 [Rhodococcus pyridinivorans]|nr:hypothetical protein SAMN04490240_0268 [Rhodococcus pyridinivorans]